MNYKNVRNQKEKAFKRSTDVSRAMFVKMLEVVKADLRDFGRTLNLSRENLLLMMYWYEYRPKFPIGVS